MQVTAPYLRSEYGKDFDYDSPVKLLDILLHGKSKRPDQQVVVLGHVLAADCTIGYEDLQNYQVIINGPWNPPRQETHTDELRLVFQLSGPSLPVCICTQEFLGKWHPTVSDPYLFSKHFRRTDSAWAKLREIGVLSALKGCSKIRILICTAIYAHGHWAMGPEAAIWTAIQLRGTKLFSLYINLQLAGCLAQSCGATKAQKELALLHRPWYHSAGVQC